MSEVPCSPDSPFKFEDNEKKDKKSRQSLSGIACPENSSGQRLCLAVFDEGGGGRLANNTNVVFTSDNDAVKNWAVDLQIANVGQPTC